MRFYLIPFIIFSLLITSCGGGSSESEKPVVVANGAPVISSSIGLFDDSGDGVIESLESFDLLLKITDQENDLVTGSVEVNGLIINLAAYIGNDDYSHKATLALYSFGDYIAKVSVSDDVNTNVTTSYKISVIPNKLEIQEEFDTTIGNFIAGGKFDDFTLLGKTTHEFNTTIGYVATTLNEKAIAHNLAPSGECGVNTPHKLLSVDVSSAGISIPDLGVVFPLECLSPNQIHSLNHTKIKQNATVENKETNNNAQLTNYIAQHFVITNDSESGITITQTGEGISLEGEVSRVMCDELELTKEGDIYRLTDEQINSAFTGLTAQQNNFTLNCQRSVIFNNTEESAPLLGIITGELQTIDSTFPTGTIDTITFSVPYLEGGLDQGTICVSTTTEDNIEVTSEKVSLVADDGLTDSLLLTLNDNTNQYCADLQGFDGQVHITQTITDDANNVLVNTSGSYNVEKNDAPEFNSELVKKVSLKANQGNVTLVTLLDVVDPEGQSVTLSGETSFDTNQSIGTYTITATASDPYGAQSTITFTITLSNNAPPTANIVLSGEPSKIGEALRDINNTIILTLSSMDTDGTINSSNLTTSLNDGVITNIENYSSTYTHNISAEGDMHRRFIYQVTDNDGFDSAAEMLEFTIHKNTPPTYTGEKIFTAERGSCITIDPKGHDQESDEITFSIEDENWELCQNEVIQVQRNITLTDTYLASSVVPITVDFTECGHSTVWWNNTCSATDTTPDEFSFTNQNSVALNAIMTSNNITISGINSAAVISIVGGSYSINGKGYTTATKTVNNGDVVNVKVTSSGLHNTTTTAILNVGEVKGNFSVTTITPDLTPNPFSFVNQANVSLNSVITSNSITITGINGAAPMSIVGGTYSVNGSSYTAVSSTLNNGDTVSVNVTSSGSYTTTTGAMLDIGGEKGYFNVTTRAIDTSPNSFSFISQTNVELNSQVTSNTISISGIESAAVISVLGGSYSINGGNYTQVVGLVNNGDAVSVRVVSSSLISTDSEVLLNIGGVLGYFNVTTLGPDTTPNLFNFTNQAGVTINTEVISNTVTVSGINSPSSISISGGSYSLNGAGYAITAGVVNNGDTVSVKLISSGLYDTTKIATLLIGGVEGQFNVTTLAADITPDLFNFTSQTGVAINTIVTSNTITIMGINSASPISIVDGSYNINGGSYTSSAGVVNNSDLVSVRVTSSGVANTATQATLTIGGVNSDFSVTTGL